MTALLSQLTAAKNGLEDAQITLCGAVTAHAEAKRGLELSEARFNQRIGDKTTDKKSVVV